METHEIPDPMDDREGFLAIRAPFFNASDTATLFSAHPFKTAADVWLNKVVGTEQEETSAMRRGQHLESAIAGWYGQEYGRRVDPNHLMYSVGRLAATPDYWTNEIPIEIKTTSLFTGDTPAEYWIMQAQTQMICTETDMVVVVWMDAALELHMVEVDADPVLQAEIISKANTFMEAVEAELMPDYVSLEAKHVIDMHPAPKGSIDGGEDGRTLAADYHEHKQAEKYHKEQAADLRDALAATMLDYDTLTYDDEPVATFKSRKTPARFDAKRFQEEHAGLAEDYMVPAGTTRVLVIPKKAKEMFASE